MATTIKLKNSVTTTNAPSSLVQGEVAINVTDKKVWVGNAATTPVQLLGTGSDGSFTNISVSGVGSFADGTVSLPAITNIGDTNTGIFFPAADTIAFSEGGVEAMRLDSSGNVGVGTTNPAVKFQVSSSTAADGAIARLELTNTSVFGGDKYGQLQFFGNDSSSTASGIRAYVNGDATGSNGEAAIVFGTANTNAAVAERMRIDSAGNVGIGTSSPADKLVIAGGNLLFSGSNFVYSYAGGTSAQVRSGINFDGTNTEMEFYVAQAEVMRIDSSSNFIVGATTGVGSVGRIQAVQAAQSAAGLSVDATNANFNYKVVYLNTTRASSTAFDFIQATTGGYGTVQFRVRGDGNVYNTNGVYSTVSDIKLKENIANATSKLEKLNQVRVVNYNLKDSELKQIGFIAQELEQVFPSLVEDTADKDVDGTDLGTTTKSVKLTVFIPILVKAIQEQQAIITDLKARIETLESK